MISSLLGGLSVARSLLRFECLRQRYCNGDEEAPAVRAVRVLMATDAVADLLPWLPLASAPTQLSLPQARVSHPRRCWLEGSSALIL